MVRKRNWVFLPYKDILSFFLSLNLKKTLANDSFTERTDVYDTQTMRITHLKA